MYHRIGHVEQDPFELNVSEENFAQQLAVIKKIASSMTVGGVTEQILHNQWQHRSVIITFDDGYADNLLLAKPILESYNIPATIFVTSDFIDKKNECWSDSLEQLFFSGYTFPLALKLTLAGKSYSWDFSGQVAEKPSSLNFRWTVFENSNPSIFHSIFMEIFHLLRDLSTSDKECCISQIRSQLGVEEILRPTCQFLTTEQLIHLAESDLIEIGGHSKTHEVLSTLALEKQESEIIESKRYIEQVINKPINSFCFPYGSKNDYSIETLSLLKKAGYQSSCAGSQGTIRRNLNENSQSLFELPRYRVGNWGGEQFENLLRWWFIR